MNWSIFAACFGAAITRGAFHEYRKWKAARAFIPMDWDPRKKAFEADYKLRKLETRVMLGIGAVIAAHVVIDYNVVANGWFSS